MSEAEKIHVLDKRVALYQPANGFRTSLDSVMLAAACPARAGDRVVDMGCGVGGAGFCVLARVPGAHLTGIDIQQSHIELAHENTGLNKDIVSFLRKQESDSGVSPDPGVRRDDKTGIKFICCDIRDYDVADKNERFDHVICNPPYMEAGAHTASPSEEKAVAKGHNSSVSLQDWLDAAFRLLKNGGSLTIIHRADAVDRLIQGLGKRFGATEIIPLWPRAGQDARRVIIRAYKDRKSPARIHPGIVLHEEDGSYTTQADKVLRAAQAIL